METPRTLLWIPESGLFFRKGKFYNGHGVEVPWDGTIHVYPDQAAADRARANILTKNPWAAGSIVDAEVHLKESTNANQT